MPAPICSNIHRINEVTNNRQQLVVEGFSFYAVAEISTTTKEQSDDTWRHFSFICSKALVDKVQAIAHKEGFTIRSFMEYVMKQGIEAYESKHGKVKKIRSKEIHEVM